MDLSKYKELYISEAEEILLALENGILGLEKDNDESTLVDELFRQAHNLKGISGAMAYDSVMSASHLLENILDKIRKKEISVEGATSDVLLQAVDQLCQLVQDAITENVESADADKLTEFGELLDSLKQVDQTVASDPEAEPAKEESKQPTSSDDTTVDSGKYKSDISTVKVDLEALDRLMDKVGELIISRIRLLGLAREAGNKNIIDELISMGRLNTDLQNEVMELRLVPVGQIFQRFKRLVRDVSREIGKNVELEISGSKIGLDRTVLENMVDPLIHLIRNSIDHGIETGPERLKNGKSEIAKIALTARRERNTVTLEVKDDGRGIDLEKVQAQQKSNRGLVHDEKPLSDENLCDILTAPGFSTSAKVDNLSGRGMGMNIVKNKVERLGGTMNISSQPGQGTSISLHLPISLSIIKALLFRVGPEVHALPIECVKETVRIEWDSIKSIQGREVLIVNDEVVPLVRADDMYGDSNEPQAGRFIKVLMVSQGTKKAALIIGELLGQQDVVIKGLPGMMSHLNGISGATILENGRIAFVWDPKIFFQEGFLNELNEQTVNAEG